MKYAFILANKAFSPHGGIKVQAKMWKDGLENIGHEVCLINFWDQYDWGAFDAIIVFGFSNDINNDIKIISSYNNNIFIAPIIDPNIPVWKYKMICRWAGCCKHLKISSKFHNLWYVRNFFSGWLVRSKEEFKYVNKCFDIPEDKIVLCPLHVRIPLIHDFPEKEDFCLHVSRLDAPIKNVNRIIEAAKKYGFMLKLAGSVKGEKNKKWLENAIAGYDNIEYLGLLSDEELQGQYKKAKVFALPSLVEGVGMVALEAASYGAEIVLTNLGAPKEYYDGKALLVDPYSVDEIGSAILKAMKGFSQPGLKSFIEGKYSEEACMSFLNSTIEKLCDRS